MRAAMARATDFMMNTVSNRGGFVWKYSLDLKQKYGELKARDSMIWAQPPGTPSVGPRWSRRTRRQAIGGTWTTRTAWPGP